MQLIQKKNKVIHFDLRGGELEGGADKEALKWKSLKFTLSLTHKVSKSSHNRFIIYCCFNIKEVEGQVNSEVTRLAWFPELNKDSVSIDIIKLHS